MTIDELRLRNTTYYQNGYISLEFCDAVANLIDAALSEPARTDEVTEAIEECNAALNKTMWEFHGEGSKFHFSTDAIRLFQQALRQMKLVTDAQDITGQILGVLDSSDSSLDYPTKLLQIRSIVEAVHNPDVALKQMNPVSADVPTGQDLEDVASYIHDNTEQINRGKAIKAWNKISTFTENVSKLPEPEGE